MGFRHMNQHGRSIQVHDSTGGACHALGMRRDLDQIVLTGNNKGVQHTPPPGLVGVLHIRVISCVTFIKHPQL